MPTRPWTRHFGRPTAAPADSTSSINNAGYGVFGTFAGRDFADWRRQLDAMLGRTLRLSHLALRGMLARNRGALVNVSSLAAEFPLPFMSGYNVVKAGLAAFSESLMIEVAGTGVIVIDFRPAITARISTRRCRPTQGCISRPSRRRRTAAQRAWAVLEANLRTAPPPARAAADLRRALRRHRSGTVRSGSFFPGAARAAAGAPGSAAPAARVPARYFGCS